MSKNRVTQHTQVEAKDFFARLAVYSAEYVRVAINAIHRFWPSKNCYEEWDKGGPIGHVLHYTAGTNFAGTVRHFVTEHRASSNWVVARALDPVFEETRRKLELDKDLRAEVVQIVPPASPSWHSGWVNRFLAGTEVRNAGILRPWPKKKGKPPSLVQGISQADFLSQASASPDDLDFYWWPNGWTSKFSGEVTNLRGTWWETWSRGSVATVIVLLRYLNSLYPGRLRPEWMLCHHNLNPGKNDCVLLPNAEGIRNAVLYDRTHVDDIPWLAELDDVEEKFSDSDEPWMLRALGDRQADRAEEDLEGFDPAQIDGVVDTPDEVKEGLQRLGYFVESEQTLSASVRIFQRSRELLVDGVAGSRTQEAIERELKKWRLK